VSTITPPRGATQTGRCTSLTLPDCAGDRLTTAPDHGGVRAPGLSDFGAPVCSSYAIPLRDASIAAARVADQSAEIVGDDGRSTPTSTHTTKAGRTAPTTSTRKASE